MELISYMFNMFALMFWLFRLYVAGSASLGMETDFYIPNMEAEIALIFITLFSIVMIFRRNIIFASIYLAAYFAYFGYGISQYMSGEASIDTISVFVMVLGIVIALLNFLDVLFNPNRKSKTMKKNVDWFYNNEKYDRELDERADKNQYKIR